MKDPDPAFPLLGAREHVHSTSILSFLDGLPARSKKRGLTCPPPVVLRS
jgi:hypothetical protein